MMSDDYIPSILTKPLAQLREEAEARFAEDEDEEEDE
jgi:hypothetical protein